MNAEVQCQFKHIPSKRDSEQIVANIETFVHAKVFDRKGIKNCGDDGNGTHMFMLTRQEANKLRDELAHVLPNDNSPVWFNIISDPLNSLIPRSLVTTSDDHQQGSTFHGSCQFGSLRSYNQFYSHVSFDKKIVQISFKPERSLPDSLHIDFDDIRLVIPFDSIQKKNILVNKEHDKYGVYILLPLKYTPYVYRLVPIKDDDKWNAKTDKKQIRICGDDQRTRFIRDLAYSSDVVFQFGPSENMAWSFLNYFLIDRPARYQINFSIFRISEWTKINERPDPFDYKTASFQDRYALQMLTSLGYVFRDKWAQLSDQQLHWDKWDVHQRYAFCCFAVAQLRADHGYDLTRTERDYHETRRKAAKSDDNLEEQEILIEKKQRLKVAVCTLTPSKTIFQPLEITTGSRALRNLKFGGVERFLLVHFREEDNRQLRATNYAIKQRLKNTMLHGIELFGKKFKYFGASTGQMKEMGFWFIDLPSALKGIIQGHNLLGNFDTIKNIATYIARVGQYFSTTWPIGIQLTVVKDKRDIRSNSELNYVLEIDDIERNKKCFTDGIGKISWGLAGRIAQRMQIPLLRKEDIPSAYQVRVAGCKGMVAIDPDSTMNDYYIHVRPSMIKFDSDDWNLEICEFARPMTLTLNNQVIRLLSDLGNHNDRFIALQKRGFTQWEVPEEQQPSAIDIAVQKNASYSLSKDNLLTNRIPIPPEDGRNLFGVADETGELKYGQCFIQYSSFDSTNNTPRKCRVVTGTVIVTKNPCLWPGDFRRLTAVLNKKLESCMRDVIVFPVNGDRPHPNEISGSDLDGDQYWVYWGDKLSIEQCAKPLSYEGARKRDVPSITDEIIIDHIVDSFGAGVILGMIANTHTAVADKHDKHSFSDECRTLAELFSLAVDSPKTGKFVDKSEIRPFQKDYCKEWPNFMRKFGEKSYKSTSILEILFGNAELRYYEWKERPMINVFQQIIRAIQNVPVTDIEDKGFKKWLDGSIYEETANRKKCLPKTTKESNDDDNDSQTASASISSQKGKNTARSKTTDESTQGKTKIPTMKVLEEPLATSNSVSKTPSNAEASHSLINSGATASASSSLASLSKDGYHPDFLLVVNAKIIASSLVQFSPISEGFYAVNANKHTPEEPNREQTIKKLTSYLEKQDVFKKKPSMYDVKVHGSLCLMVFYGRIDFIEQNSFPEKFHEVQKLIKEKSDELIHFRTATMDELHEPSTSASTTEKDAIDYEFDCFLSSTPSEYLTFSYNNKKVLRQVCVYRTWSKCYVRQPDFNVDSLYEIRSGIVYDSDASEFVRIRESVFQTQSTGFFVGRKPAIKLNRGVLRSTVVPVGLRIIEEDLHTVIDGSDMKSFYRKVKNVSLDEQQEKPSVCPTMEYHFSPISKDEDVLQRACTFALSPVKDTVLNRR